MTMPHRYICATDVSYRDKGEAMTFTWLTSICSATSPRCDWLSEWTIISAARLLGSTYSSCIGFTVARYWSITCCIVLPRSDVSRIIRLISRTSGAASTKTLTSSKSTNCGCEKIRIPSRMIIFFGYVVTNASLSFLVWDVKSYLCSGSRLAGVTKHEGHWVSRETSAFFSYLENFTRVIIFFRGLY